jgi:hypothetical protein
LIDVNEWHKRRAKQEHCFVVYEDNQETKNFIKEAHRRHQDPKLVEAVSAEAAALLPLSHISEDPNFQEKRVAHPLILADFVAFMLKRHLMRDPYASRFVQPLWGRLSHLA